MGEFKVLQTALKKQFDKLSTSQYLYTMDLPKGELWDVYLNSFPKGTNNIFRERREHDCSCCRHFIHLFGDVVAIINGKIETIWDFDIDNSTYKPVVKALKKYVKSKPIKNVFVHYEKNISTKTNHEDDNGTIRTWNHFYVTLPSKYIKPKKDIDTIRSKHRDIYNVFKRSLEEISIESVDTVLELINQNSLYKGNEWKTILEEFRKHHITYTETSNKEIYLWSQSVNVGVSLGKIRNHSIGTLLTDIGEGMPLDKAVKRYEKIVAPTNYKRPKPIFTKAMLDKAKKKVSELGFTDALQRRFAILEDISVNNVLFANRDSVQRMQTNDPFEEMKKEVKNTAKKFDKVEEISIQDFIKNVLPTAKNIEIYLENKHSNNMVSLIAPYNAKSKTMFKWNNNFSWAYTGNITDSDIKGNVKMAGGKIDGVLRFSIQWNDETVHNTSDYDAHCHEPDGNLIYFSNTISRQTGGNLDVDIIDPKKGEPAVENITWSNKSKMLKGTYTFLVHNYNDGLNNTGFRAEIEFNNEIYKFEYPHKLKEKEKINVADVFFDDSEFTLIEKLKAGQSSKEIWNLNTNSFIPVSVIMYSPNYWDEQKGIGHQHCFFMLKDCINSEQPNGFFNEYLSNELTEHRKVFEALGSKMKVDDADGQLSGVGFSLTKRNELVVKIEGQTKRILKIKI